MKPRHPAVTRRPARLRARAHPCDSNALRLRARRLPLLAGVRDRRVLRRGRDARDAVDCPRDARRRRLRPQDVTPPLHAAPRQLLQPAACSLHRPSVPGGFRGAAGSGPARACPRAVPCDRRDAHLPCARMADAAVALRLRRVLRRRVPRAVRDRCVHDRDDARHGAADRLAGHRSADGHRARYRDCGAGADRACVPPRVRRLSTVLLQLSPAACGTNAAFGTATDVHGRQERSRATPVTQPFAARRSAPAAMA